MIVSHEICGASIVTEYICKAEQVRIINNGDSQLPAFRKWYNMVQYANHDNMF